MTLPSGFLNRYRAFLDEVSAAQAIPTADLDRHFTAYPESVIQFLVHALEEGGRPGFTDAYRLIDVLEALNCRDLHVVAPEDWDPVVVRLQRADGHVLRASFTRAALNLSRPRLVQLVKEETGISRSTKTASRVRSRDLEQGARDLDVQSREADAPADPDAGRRKSKKITRSILAQPPEGAGPHEDDGLTAANPLASWSWSMVLGQITAVAGRLGCSKLQIGKVGTGGIVRLQAEVPDAGAIDCYLAPNIIVDAAILEASLETHIERRRASRQQAAEAASVPDAVVSDSTEIELDAVTGEPVAPTSALQRPLEGRIVARCRELGYPEAATEKVGNGRYLRVSATDPAGRTLIIACAIDSVSGLDDDALDERLRLLFERASQAD